MPALRTSRRLPDSTNASPLIGSLHRAEDVELIIAILNAERGRLMSIPDRGLSHSEAEVI